MKSFQCTIDLFSFWSITTGTGEGRKADTKTCKDKDNLPIIPGKALKGLFRDAFQDMEDHGLIDPGTTDKLCGKEGIGRDGLLRFSTATVNKQEKQWFLGSGKACTDKLYQSVSSTSLDEFGVTKNKHLRDIEVCLPVSLEAYIDLSATTDDEEQLFLNCYQTAASLIKKIGFRRNRGYGRCAVTLEEVLPAESAATQQESQIPSFEILVDGSRQCWLLLELLEDIIISADSTSQCKHRCLDYIPGSKLLGVAAAELFKKTGFGADIFLSGRLRFGPGLLLAEDKNIPAFPMPLSFYTDKAHHPSDIQVLNGLFPDEFPETPVVQLRSGEVVFDGNVGECHTPVKNRCLKSARDRDNFGTAVENQLFNFESLGKGQKYLFPIWADKDVAEETVMKVAQTLLQQENIYLGRSRKAEFGKVRVSLPPDNINGFVLQSFADAVEESSGYNTVSDETTCVFYLVSDLSLYNNGVPTLHPFPEAFGLSADTTVYDAQKSYLRTRSYAPWNGFHRCQELERQVIERGSVISFSLTRPLNEDDRSSILAHISGGVGAYRQEGLGVVLLNPSFVLSPPDLLQYRDAEDSRPVTGETACETPLTTLIYSKAVRGNQDEESRKIGRKWAETWIKTIKKLRNDGSDGPGISQWGEVRGFAVSSRGNAMLLIKTLDEFIQSTRRQRWWQGKVITVIFSSWQETFKEFPKFTDKEKELLFTMSFYHAASQMMVLLKNEKVNNQ